MVINIIKFKELYGHRVNACLILQEIAKIFSKVNFIFYPPINNINHFLSSLKIVAGSPFNLAILENMQFYVFVVLICIYLTANGIQCLPMSLLAIHTSLFVNSL